MIGTVQKMVPITRPDESYRIRYALLLDSGVRLLTSVTWEGRPVRTGTPVELQLDGDGHVRSATPMEGDSEEDFATQPISVIA